MTRILFTLASFSIILLVAALILGLSMDDLYAQPHPDQNTLHWATIHRLTGLAAALDSTMGERFGSAVVSKLLEAIAGR